MLEFLSLDAKPPFSLGFDLAPNLVCLHPLIKGYDFLVMYEAWVNLKNAFFISGIHLEFWLSFLDPKHNGAI